MYKFDLLSFDEFEIIKETEKTFYNTDSKVSLKKWSNSKKRVTSDLPQVSSPLIIKQRGRGKMVKNAFGYLLSGGNNIGENTERFHYSLLLVVRGMVFRLWMIIFLNPFVHFLLGEL